MGVNAYLLKTAKPTDTCLRCHARPGSENGYGVFGTSVLTPKPERGAGDYVFLLEDNLNDGQAAPPARSPATPVATTSCRSTKGIVADPVNTTAPGRHLPGRRPGLLACHDPHGTDSFRLLYGANRLVHTDGTTFTFTQTPPEAVGIALNFAVRASQPHRVPVGHERLVRQLPR